MSRFEPEITADVILLQNFLKHDNFESLLKYDSDKLRRLNRLFQCVLSQDAFAEEFPDGLLSCEEHSAIIQLIPKCIRKATIILGDIDQANAPALFIPPLIRVALLELIDTLMRDDIISAWITQTLAPINQRVVNSLKFPNP